MERRSGGQEAAAALHAALVCLQARGPPVKDLPLAPGAWARPTLKAMQAALYLLHLRIRGPARTKKELQHVYPVLEPAQAREFKAAMQEWVRELGAGGALAPETVKYFVSAYQGSAAHRAVLMLLDLSALALAKELAAPLATLPDAELLQPAYGGGTGAGVLPPPPPRRAATAAAAAQRQLQARLDSVVAAMQRLRQLAAQAAGQLAAGQAASGSAAAALAPRVPPLFAGSQAAAKRGELVAELLAHGPPLTAQPEAVGPESWSDLLAAGRAAGAAPGAPAGAAASALTPMARRLSNPAQEASSFAAEGLAADADVLTVHAVLVQRLAALNTALQAAVVAGAAPGSAEVQALLAEAASYRESLMLSVRQELAAAEVQAEQQPEAASSSSRPSMLQLVPPGPPPHNPVTEGMQAAQQASAAAAAGGVAGGSSSRGWEPPEPAALESLRCSMWQRMLSRGSNSSSSEPGEATGEAVTSPGNSPPASAAEDLPSPQSPRPQAASPVAGASCSKGARGRRAAPAIDSPSLEAMLSESGCALDSLALLADLPDEGLASPRRQQQQQQQQLSWQPSRRQQLGSPMPAESCASASVMGETGGGAAAARSRRQGQSSRAQPLPLASPMQSAAASFMPPPRQRLGEQQRQWHQQQQASTGTPPPPAAAPSVTLSPPLRLLDGMSPLADSPALRRLRSSSSLDAGSPAAPAASWRQAAAAAAGGAPSPAPGSGGGSRRRRPASYAFTPPRTLSSPLPERQQQHSHHLAGPDSPARVAAAGDGDGDATPVSRPYLGHAASSPLPACTPGPSPVLQPLHQQQRQQQQQQQQQWRQASGGWSSPGIDLLASCFKSRPGALAPSPFAEAAEPLSPVAAAAAAAAAAGYAWEQQPSSPRWAISAGRSGSGSGGGGPLGSPLGSGGRRRSAVVTTSSPLGPAHSLDVKPQPPSRLGSSRSAAAAEAARAPPAAAAAAAASPTIDELLGGPKRFDSPGVSSLSLRSTKAAGGGGGGGGDVSAVMERFARLKGTK